MRILRNFRRALQQNVFHNKTRGPSLYMLPNTTSNDDEIYRALASLFCFVSFCAAFRCKFKIKTIAPGLSLEIDSIRESEKQIFFGSVLCIFIAPPRADNQPGGAEFACLIKENNNLFLERAKLQAAHVVGGCLNCNQPQR